MCIYSWRQASAVYQQNQAFQLGISAPFRPCGHTCEHCIPSTVCIPPQRPDEHKFPSVTTVDKIRCRSTSAGKQTTETMGGGSGLILPSLDIVCANVLWILLQSLGTALDLEFALDDWKQMGAARCGHRLLRCVQHCWQCTQHRRGVDPAGVIVMSVILILGVFLSIFWSNHVMVIATRIYMHGGIIYVSIRLISHTG